MTTRIFSIEIYEFISLYFFILAKIPRDLPPLKNKKINELVFACKDKFIKTNQIILMTMVLNVV